MAPAAVDGGNPIMEIVQVARVVSAALTTAVEASAHPHSTTASAATLRSLRQILARSLGGEPAPGDLTPEDLASGLSALSETELREVLLLAQVVLMKTDPRGTAAGRYTLPGAGDDVRVVRRGEAGSRTIEAIQQLSAGVPVPPAHPADAERIGAVVSHRSPEHVNMAISVTRQLLGNCESELGEAHPATLATRINLAHLYRSAGRIADAIETMEQVVVHRRRTYGLQDPDSRAAEATLDEWRRG
jgi:hypothetical protein